MKKTIALALAALVATSTLLTACSPSPEKDTSPSPPVSVSPTATATPSMDAPTETATISTMVEDVTVTVDQKVTDEWKEVGDGQYQLSDELFAQVIVQTDPLLASIKNDRDMNAFFSGLVAGFTDTAASEFPDVKETSEVLRDFDNNPYTVTQLEGEGTGVYFLIAKLVDNRSIVVVISPLDETITTGSDWVDTFSTVV